MKHAPKYKVGPVEKPSKDEDLRVAEASAGYYPQLFAELRNANPGTLIERIRAGLPLADLELLRRSLGLPFERLTEKLGMSRATLHRRKATGRLAPDESDKVVRFAALFNRAVDVFGDVESARAWLGHPQVGLGGEIPLDYAQTEIGAREVEKLLGRIDYGVLT